MAKKSNWKEAERRLATFFNTVRRPLSGLNHGTGRGDDCQHERLYLESKHGSNSAVVMETWKLYLQTRAKCLKETKGSLIPILGLQRTSHPGILLVVHSDNLEALCVEYLNQTGYRVVDQDDCNVVFTPRAIV